MAQVKVNQVTIYPTFSRIIFHQTDSVTKYKNKITKKIETENQIIRRGCLPQPKFPLLN